MIIGIVRPSAHSITRRVTTNHQPFSMSVVLFDGVCHLCSRTVQYLLEKDRHQLLKFASLQGKTAKIILERYPELGSKNNLKSVVYVREYNSPEEQVFLRSDAILTIFSDIETVNGWVRTMSYLPRFVRNLIYRLVARFRYRWFGKYQKCWLPDVKWTERFLP